MKKLCEKTLIVMLVRKYLLNYIQNGDSDNRFKKQRFLRKTNALYVLSRVYFKAVKNKFTV